MGRELGKQNGDLGRERERHNETGREQKGKAGQRRDRVKVERGTEG